MIGGSGWLAALGCIYTTWGVRSLTSPCPNSTTRPSLRITLKSERSHDQPVMRRCVYSSCSYGPLLRTASGRPRTPTTCCRVMPGSSLDICSPVVQAERRETTEIVSNSAFMHAPCIRSGGKLARRFTEQPAAPSRDGFPRQHNLQACSFGLNDPAGA
jgi:hypothetical protein